MSRSESARKWARPLWLASVSPGPTPCSAGRHLRLGNDEAALGLIGQLRTKMVLPVMTGQASSAASHGTVCEMAAVGSRLPAPIKRITSGSAARAITRPVTNLTPVVYSSSSGRGVRLGKKTPVSVHTPPGVVERRAVWRASAVGEVVTVTG
jgi:hypothetical protein